MIIRTIGIRKDEPRKIQVCELWP